MVYGDNSSAITIIGSADGPWRTRHLRLRAEVLREKVKGGRWAVRHLPVRGPSHESHDGQGSVAQVLRAGRDGQGRRGEGGGVINGMAVDREREQAEIGRTRPDHGQGGKRAPGTMNLGSRTRCLGNMNQAQERPNWVEFLGPGQRMGNPVKVFFPLQGSTTALRAAQ